MTTPTQTKPQPAPAPTTAKAAPAKPSTRKPPARTGNPAADRAARTTTTRANGTPKPAPKAAIKTPPAAKTPAKSKPAPGAQPEPEPKINIQDSKRDLARRAVEAVAAMVANLDGSEAALANMTKDEAAVCASQWIHHLPAGLREDGKRWWAGGLPRPVRSDWK